MGSQAQGRENSRDEGEMMEEVSIKKGRNEDGKQVAMSPRCELPSQG